MQSNDSDFERTVRDTAYFLWEGDGRPFGRDKEYWFTALDKCRREARKAGPDGTGEAADDNIDDLGRPVNDPRGKRLDQPTGREDLEDEP